MISQIDLRKAQTALKGRDPARRRDVLDLLGWGREGTDIVYTSARSGLGQLHLGSYPTTACVDVPTERNRTQSGWWKPSYFGDFRWSLQVAPGLLRWCDLREKRAWECRADDLAREPLEGLTPKSFASRGSLEPSAITQFDGLNEHPGKQATEYFVQQMHAWWVEFLEQSSKDVAAAQEDFIRLLSALLLLRTIEDIGGVDWLPRGKLRDVARRTGAAGDVLHVLMKRAATEVNSRVLRGIADILPKPDATANLIRKFYELDIDFSMLEVDPVGHFYQELLGTEYTVEPRPQRGMFGENRAVHADRSARRRKGSYYTPREYADVLARRLVLPAARNAREVKELPIILDITAGSGQLLCAALRQVVSIPSWRHPDALRHLLERGLLAVDEDPLALQLAALNVLRTAVLLVPEFIQAGLPFPPLDENFRQGNALCGTTLVKLPPVDVLLLNPPFKGANAWSAPDGAAQEVSALSQGRSNAAFAFLAAGLHALRPGGGVGVVLPGPPLKGDEHRPARALIGRSMRVETVIINEHSRQFGEALSYASLVTGRKAHPSWTPRTQVIEIPRERAMNDIGALAAGAVHKHSDAPLKLFRISEERPWDWTGQCVNTAAVTPIVKQELMPLSDLLGSGCAFHQAPSVAPRPWGRDLFLFDVVDESRVRHRLTNREFDGSSPTLRPVAIPNYLSRTPPYSEPVVPDLQVFLPGDGSPRGVRIDALRKSDSAGYAIASALRKEVIRTDIEKESARARKWQNLLREGHCQFNWSKGFIAAEGPLLILSKATRMPGGPGRAGGIVWSVWLNLDGSVVPIEGVYARFKDVRLAVAVAVLLNVPEAVSEPIKNATMKNMGTTQPLLSILNGWLIPRLDQPRFGVALDRLLAGFKAYRARSIGLDEASAIATKEYQELCSLGAELWRL